MTTPWSHRYALRTHNMGSSAIRELLKLTQQPDLISFAGGLPAPEMFPIEQVRAAADTVLTEVGNTAPPKATPRCAISSCARWRATASKSASITS